MQEHLSIFDKVLTVIALRHFFRVIPLVRAFSSYLKWMTFRAPLLLSQSISPCLLILFELIKSEIGFASVLELVPNILFLFDGPLHLILL